MLTDAGGSAVDPITFIDIGAGGVHSPPVSWVTGAGELSGHLRALSVNALPRRSAVNADTFVNVDAGGVETAHFISSRTLAGVLALDFLAVGLRTGPARATLSAGTLIDIDAIQRPVFASLSRLRRAVGLYEHHRNFGRKTCREIPVVVSVTGPQANPPSFECDHAFDHLLRICQSVIRAAVDWELGHHVLSPIQNVEMDRSAEVSGSVLQWHEGTGLEVEGRAAICQSRHLDEPTACRGSQLGLMCIARPAGA